MPKFESLRPLGVMVSTLGLQVIDGGSNSVLIHFHSGDACLDPYQVMGPDPSLCKRQTR